MHDRIWCGYEGDLSILIIVGKRYFNLFYQPRQGKTILVYC